MSERRAALVAAVLLMGLGPSVAAAGESGAEPYIVGGQPAAAPGSVSAAAIYTPAGFRCTGVVVGPSELLTAGHCVSDLPTEGESADTAAHTSERFSVRVGTDRTAGPLRPAQAVLHPGWSWHRAGAADISALRAPVGDVAPVELAEVDPAKPVVVLGWGYGFPAEQIPPPFQQRLPHHLRQVEMTVTTPDRCQIPVEEGFPLAPDHELCLIPQGPSQGACDGDSGGPVLQDGRVVGLVSRGDRPCGQHPLVVTKVSAFSDWVRDPTPS